MSTRRNHSENLPRSAQPIDPEEKSKRDWLEKQSESSGMNRFLPFISRA
jgi:hypothetical protein